jgi:hypothetical protein
MQHCLPQEYSKLNYLDILVRASIDVTAAAENIKLPHAGTQVRDSPASCRLYPMPTASVTLGAQVPYSPVSPFRGNSVLGAATPSCILIESLKEVNSVLHSAEPVVDVRALAQWKIGYTWISYRNPSLRPPLMLDRAILGMPVTCVTGIRN